MYLTSRIIQWELFPKNGMMSILIILVANAKGDGTVSVNRDFICKRTRLSENTVDARIDDLKAYGVITEDKYAVWHLNMLPEGIELNAPARKKRVKADVEHGIDETHVPSSSPTPLQAKSSRFVPPKIEEVRAYILQKGYHFTAEEFWYHYDSNGWKVGKNPMKRWQSACVTFEQNWKKHTKRGQNPYARVQKYEEYVPVDTTGCVTRGQYEASLARSFSANRNEGSFEEKKQRQMEEMKRRMNGPKLTKIKRFKPET